MKCTKSTIALLGVAAALTLGSCNIYKKYETPADTPIMQEYANALEETPDANAFGNLQWQQVFTDPQLADLIDRALNNNKNLQNAKLNVDIAQAQLRRAPLS